MGITIEEQRKQILDHIGQVILIKTRNNIGSALREVTIEKVSMSKKYIKLRDSDLVQNYEWVHIDAIIFIEALEPIKK